MQLSARDGTPWPVIFDAMYLWFYVFLYFLFQFGNHCLVLFYVPHPIKFPSCVIACHTLMYFHLCLIVYHLLWYVSLCLPLLCCQIVCFSFIVLCLCPVLACAPRVFLIFWQVFLFVFFILSTAEFHFHLKCLNKKLKRHFKRIYKRKLYKKSLKYLQYRPINV